MSVETYIYDFNEDIYGEDIEIYLKKFRRPERRFESVEELKAQLKRDIMR
jgi:riboflavin kinase/FMN adenylyltransferase